jgi:transcriptional regulator with XRE-family HTH domain
MGAEWFAGRLKELRAAACLTQQQLAEKAGVAVGVIRKLERDENKPSWQTVVKLCKAMGVSSEEFMRPPSPTLPPTVAGRPKKPSTSPAEANVEKADDDAADAKPRAAKKGRKAKGK